MDNQTLFYSNLSSVFGIQHSTIQIIWIVKFALIKISSMSLTVVHHKHQSCHICLTWSWCPLVSDQHHHKKKERKKIFILKTTQCSGKMNISNSNHLVMAGVHLCLKQKSTTSPKYWHSPLSKPKPFIFNLPPSAPNTWTLFLPPHTPQLN